MKENFSEPVQKDPNRSLIADSDAEVYPVEIMLDEFPGGQTVETQIDEDTTEVATWLS